MTTTMTEVPAGLDSVALTAEDRKLVAFVASYRKAQNEGPAWGEVRRVMGQRRAWLPRLPPADWWADHEPRWAAKHPFEKWWARRPTIPESEARSAWRNDAWRQWKAKQGPHDPVADRIRRLSHMGWLVFTETPRSLDLSPAARALIGRRQSARMAAESPQEAISAAQSPAS